MKHALMALAAILLPVAPAVADPVASAIAAPDRPAADTARDADRKPAALLAFAGIAPGQTVADILPGGGYFTRIFSKLVGPAGHVDAVIPAEILQVAPKAADATRAIAAEPGYANVAVVVSPAAELAVPAPVDVAWTSQNYHDVYGFDGPAAAAAFDAAVFRMLKPGGTFIVIDHAAAPGSGDIPEKTLHRIDPAIVKAQVAAAGFVLVGESDALRNPADDHSLKVFDPAIRGHTDQFVLRFRKPG